MGRVRVLALTPNNFVEGFQLVYGSVLVPRALTHKFVEVPLPRAFPGGCGCQNRFGMPFCLVAEFTTHFTSPELAPLVAFVLFGGSLCFFH